MDDKAKLRPRPLGFTSLQQLNVAQSKRSKLKQFIQQLLSDLQLLEYGKALKIPLVELPDSKENICSLLCRASKLREMSIEAVNDVDNLYVWKAGEA